MIFDYYLRLREKRGNYQFDHDVYYFVVLIFWSVFTILPGRSAAIIKTVEGSVGWVIF